tara:strand:+ start:24062 stop:25120 length:1059 start_codon:yes stop_codon:yes gene_type:complete
MGMAFDTLYLGNTLGSYLFFFLILVGAVLIGKTFYWLSKNILRKFFEKTRNNFDNILLDVLERPLVFLIFIIGLMIGLNTLVLSSRMAEVFGNVTVILFILDGTWFITGLVDALLTFYIHPLTTKTKSDLDDHLLPILKKLSKVVIIAIALIMIIDNFGYDVTSLIAGLGLGGLAFALAAQDMLGNMFGGVAILTDKPFKVGQRIKVDNKYDGFVKEIGIRSTRIETFDGTQLILPNSMISNSVLENVSKEKARRVVMMVGLTYDTSSKKIEEAKEIIKEIVLKNKDTEDESNVIFYEFADSSLNLRIVYRIRNLDEIFNVRDQVNTEIKKRFDKSGIDMAFPTRTVYMKKG